MDPYKNQAAMEARIRPLNCFGRGLDRIDQRGAVLVPQGAWKGVKSHIVFCICLVACFED